MDKQDALALLDAMTVQIDREPPRLSPEHLATAFASVVSAEPARRPEPWMHSARFAWPSAEFRAVSPS